MKPQQREVLITGASGFIGFETVRLFIERGWFVRAWTHRSCRFELSEYEQQGKLDILSGDLADATALTRAFAGKPLPEAVVHCAGFASDIGPERHFQRANFESVKVLADWVAQTKINRLVFVSTTDVYGLRDFSGETEDELSFDQSPWNFYPRYKILAEEMLRERLPQEQWSIIRPAAVWGSGDRTLTPRFRDFLSWSPWILHFGCWRGQNRWPLAHVRNVALSCFLAATRAEASGCAIQVVDSRQLSIDAFYRAVGATHFPTRHYRSMTLPLWFGKLLGWSVSAISNMLNLEHAFMDPSLYAMYSVSCHLDFSNRRMLELFAKAGETEYVGDFSSSLQLNTCLPIERIGSNGERIQIGIITG